MFQTSTLLFIRRGKISINRILALLVGLLTFSLWNFYTYSVGLPAYYRLIDFDSWYTTFFWGPTLYFYIGMLTGQIQLNNRIFLKHYAFGLVLICLGLTTYLPNYETWFPTALTKIFSNAKLMSFYVQISLYFLACFQLLKTYNAKIRDNFASVEEMNLSWLYRLLIIFALLIAVDMTITVPSVLTEAVGIPYLEVYLLAEALAIFAIGYFSLLHAGSVFHDSKPKYESSPLDNQLSQDLLIKLKTLMQDSKPYKNNNLKLDDLAQLVGISPYYLSQIINQQCQKNFYDFINEYRSKSAAELLLANNEIKITQVAFEAGFNNRTSFNTAFKKHIGMTPSQYRFSQNNLPSKKVH